MTTVQINPTSKLKSIGWNAFYGNSNLKALYIPNGIIIIRQNMCESCTSLKTLTIPDSVIVIEYGAFRGATKLKCINWDSSIQRNIQSNALPTKKECLRIAPTIQPTQSADLVTYACTDLTGCCQGHTDITISTEIIPSRAFKGCANIATIVMNKVKIIMSEAFSGLTSLRSVSIPSTVEFIG